MPGDTERFGGAHGLLHELDEPFTSLGGAAVNAIMDAGHGTISLATSDGLKHVQNGRIVPMDGYTGPAFSLLRDGETLRIGGSARVCRRDVNAQPALVTCIQASRTPRETDITVRWGGEEFLLRLQDGDGAGVLDTVERLRRDIAAKRFKDGRGGAIRMTCSIGFSMHPLATRADKASFDATLELADLALYQAKHLGRNQCVGLLVTASSSADILHSPFAPQVDPLPASRRLRWTRADS